MNKSFHFRLSRVIHMITLWYKYHEPLALLYTIRAVNVITQYKRGLLMIKVHQYPEAKPIFCSGISVHVIIYCYET